MVSEPNPMTPVETVARAMKKRASEPLHNIPTLDNVLVGSLGDAWPYLARAAIAALAPCLEAIPVSTDDWDAEHWIAALIPRDCTADQGLKNDPTKVGALWK